MAILGKTAAETLTAVIAMLPSILVLGGVAIAAWVLTRTRPFSSEHGNTPSPGEPSAVARLLAIATLIQAIHFSEEALTGFHQKLPALFGLPAIPLTVFVAFNVTWLAIWCASVPGIRSRRALALFAAWFLAIAGAVNGLAHPLLALASGGYFPGLISSPFIGAIALWLGFRLWKATGS